jgi:hypothetical protein
MSDQKCKTTIEIANVKNALIAATDGGTAPLLPCSKKAVLKQKVGKRARGKI